MGTPCTCSSQQGLLLEVRAMLFFSNKPPKAPQHSEWTKTSSCVSRRYQPANPGRQKPHVASLLSKSTQPARCRSKHCGAVPGSGIAADRSCEQIARSEPAMACYGRGERWAKSCRESGGTDKWDHLSPRLPSLLRSMRCRTHSASNRAIDAWSLLASLPPPPPPPSLPRATG